MKPASIISLVIAVLLVVVGLTTCFIGQNIAKANNEYLFSETRNGDYIVTQSLNDGDISKIEIMVEDADINIFGRSETSYIEFINFSENFYTLSTSNKAVSFDEIPNITALFKFWENGFSFKGMRYILKFDSQPSPDLKKSINIYLSSDTSIKIFDIEGNDCTVNINNITVDADYKFSFNTAIINVDTFKTNSYFKINAENNLPPADSVSLKISHAYVGSMEINSNDLSADFDIIKCDNAMINCETGDVNVEFSNSPLKLNLSLSTDSGLITVDGNEFQKSYTNTGNDSISSQFVVTSDSADISVKKTSTTSQEEKG